MMNHKPPDLDYDRLYVYCDFIKPGKHQYLVSYKNRIVEQRPLPDMPLQAPEYDEYGDEIVPPAPLKPVVEDPPFEPKITNVRITSYHQFMGSAHLHPQRPDYNLNTKAADGELAVRNFSKATSIFKDWRDDRKPRIEKGFLEEIKHWKVPNFVKDPREVDQIVDFMKDNCPFLKTVFIIRSSASNYPSLRWLSYAPFISELDIIDQHFEMGAIDRIFIAVTKNMEKDLIGILPEKDMSRFQFYEALVRIAFFKYK